MSNSPDLYPDEPCFFCGSMTDHYAANPSRWPVRLPVDPKDPGRNKTVHEGCVLWRLRAHQKLVKENADLLTQVFELAGRNDQLKRDLESLAERAAELAKPRMKARIEELNPYKDQLLQAGVPKASFGSMIGWVIEQWQTWYGRTRLAYEVYHAALLATESFEEDNIGSDLAYLMAAIVNGTSVDWSDMPREIALLEILRTKFPGTHPIWKYILTDLESETEQRGADQAEQEIDQIDHRGDQN